MLRRTLLLAGAVGLGLVFFALPSAANAQDSRGVCKIYRTNGQPVEGEVFEYPDKYEIKQKAPGGKGTITITVPKTQVTKIETVAAAAEDSKGPAAAGTPGKRPTITDAMIAEILGSENIDAASLDIEDKVQVDVMSALEPDEESVRDMLRIAGPNAKKLLTDHFVFIYTSDIKLAKEMAARLEGVYRWTSWFNEKNGVKSTRPAHKLEIFFFGTFAEYDSYQTTNGFRSGGAIGFYSPTNNRSAFFDMMTYPPTLADLESAKAAGPDDRRRIQNRVKRNVDHYNRTVVQHEAAHHIHFNLGVFPRGPEMTRWAVEGLATMFETINTDSGNSYGGLNHQRLYEFRQIYGQDGERMPDLRVIILANQWFLQNGFFAYSMGWALNHYLGHSPKHKEKYKEWMRLLSARDEDQIPIAELHQQFEKLFGELNDDWKKEFIAFIKEQQLKMSEVRPEP